MFFGAVNLNVDPNFDEIYFLKENRRKNSEYKRIHLEKLKKESIKIALHVNLPSTIENL